jgi:hypothetical protein
LLAVCGRVKRYSEWQWEVRGQESHNGKTYTYHITNNGDRLVCDCRNHMNGKFEGIDFMGIHCRHVCKHIAAVAVCRGAALNGLYPLPAVNLFDTVANILTAQHVPAPKEAWVIPGYPVKLARIDRNGVDALVLQTGSTRSLPLAAWVSNTSMPSGGMWILKTDAWGKYFEFVEAAFGVKPTRSEQLSIAAASGDTEFEWGGKDSYGG